MSFARYPEYQDSGVEWLDQVPKHWEIKKVSHISDLIAGFPFPSDKFEFTPEAGIPLVRGDNVSEGFLRWGEKGRYWPIGLEYQERYLLEPGDIVIQMDGSKVGKNWALVDADDLPALLVQRVTRVRVNGAMPKFIYSLFANELFIRYVDQTKTDPAIPHITMRNIGDYWVPLPPVSEQTAIAAFLDHETAKIDALVAEQQKLIALLKEKRDAAISQAVTKGLDPMAKMKDSGVEWLGSVPAHWSVSALAYHYSVQLGKMLDAAKITGNNLQPYLRVFDVQWGQINVDQLPLMDFDEKDQLKFALEPGDLLVNEGGSYPGRAAIWQGQLARCYYQKALHRLRPRTENDTTRYFFYVLYWAANHGVFSAGGNEATIEHLPAEKLRRYRFPFPPINDQVAIANFLDVETVKFNDLVRNAEGMIELLRERRTALICAAVTGKIDVRGTVAVAVAEEVA